MQLKESGRVYKFNSTEERSSLCRFGLRRSIFCLFFYVTINMWLIIAEILRPDQPTSGNLENISHFPTYTVMCESLELGFYNFCQRQRQKLEIKLKLIERQRREAGEDMQSIENDVLVELEMSERRNHERWRILRDQSQEWYRKAEQEREERQDYFSADHASRGGRQM